MKNTSQKILLSKTEIVFSRKELLDLLSSANDCNIVVVTTSHFNVDNVIQISHQIAPVFLDKKTGMVTPPKKTANKRMAASNSDENNSVNGVQLQPCPYPPGCDATTLIARAANVSSALGV